MSVVVPRSRATLARAVVLAGLVAGVLTPNALTSNPARAAAPTITCAPAPGPGGHIAVVVGQVACQDLTTHLLGDGIAAPFEYYVPPSCDPVLKLRCPTMYLLHGFGGDFTEMLNTPGTTTSAWVQALTRRPPAGFESAPWNYYNPKTWQPAPTSLSMILVAPRGQTLPGGYGPGAGNDSYWVDWNPKYASRYGTPPPRFESFLIDELAPFVEAQLPAGTGRDWRAIAGVSLGGYGAYKNGLQHPDEWTTMISVSGAHNFLFGPAPQPLGVASPASVQSPIPITYRPLPAPTGAVPLGALPSQAGTFLTALDALGDPAADNAYFRGNMPPDLAMNALASARGRPSFGIDGFWNDMVARRSSDTGGTAFEVLVFPMNVDMEEAFAAQGVAHTSAIHQGNHSDVYRNAWFRGLEEFAWARLQHPDLKGTPPPWPATFSYRSIRNAFTIWGWTFTVQRPSVEFLTLRSVSCNGLSLQGTGTVTVTVPDRCHTGLHGARTFSVDLGPPSPIDDPAAAGAVPVDGTTVHVALSRR